MKSRKRRSQSQWQTLIKQQLASGLNAAEFCRQKGLNDKYFSKRKRQFSDQNSEVKQKPFIKLRTPAKASGADLVLQYQGVQLQMNAKPDAIWVAQLMKALS